MAASDLRVDLGPLLEAFGVPATVTRPAPDDTPIATSVAWMTEGFVVPVTESVPFESALQRREPQRVLSVPVATVPTLPRGTAIAAPLMLGGPVLTWLVDETVLVLPDERRVIVVPVS